MAMGIMPPVHCNFKGPGHLKCINIESHLPTPIFLKHIDVSALYL